MLGWYNKWSPAHRSSSNTGLISLAYQYLLLGRGNVTYSLHAYLPVIIYKMERIPNM